MDPNRGILYPSVEAARAAGVEHAVEMTGLREDIERIAAVVHSGWTREQRSARNARSKVARRSRRVNRGR